VAGSLPPIGIRRKPGKPYLGLPRSAYYYQPLSLCDAPFLGREAASLQSSSAGLHHQAISHP